MCLVRVDNIHKSYVMGEVEVWALRGVTFSVRKGEFLSIMGASGSGKSTLMNILGCLDIPTEGHYFLNGTDVSSLDKDQLAEIRKNTIGFVFQGFNLLAPLNALENVMEPLLLQGVKRKEAKRRAMNLIRQFGMEDRIHNLPKNLSGGQQQRIAIARSLITDPHLILCDEPTASLDHKSAKMVMEMLSQLSMDNRAVIVVTHDVRLKKYADRTIYVSEGRISETAIEDEF